MKQNSEGSEIPEYNSREGILKHLKDVRTWEPSDERSMALKALGSMLLTVMYGKQFKPGMFFDIDTYSPVLPHNRILHIFCCHWVEYDDHNSFDATKQVCLICGRTQSCILARSYAVMEDTDPDFTKNELKELNKFLETRR